MNMNMRGLAGIFYQVAGISFWTGGVLLLFLGLRLLYLRRLPRRISCFLWLLLFLRLLLPVTVETASGLVPGASRGWQAAEESRMLSGTGGIRETGYTEEAENGAAAGSRAGTENAAAAGGSSSLSGREGTAALNRPAADEEGDVAPSLRSLGVRLYAAAPYIWLLGILCISGYAAAGGLRLGRRLTTAVKVEALTLDSTEATEIRIKETDRIRSPFVMGIWRPVIYLPTGLTGQNREMVLLHERAHIRRRDPLFKLLCFAAAVLHWFNPLVWAAFLYMIQDMEMACDEAALKQADREGCIAYSEALLSLSCKKSGLLPVFFGESNTQRRVKNVLRPQHMTPGRWGMVLVTVLFLTVLLVMAGIRQEEPESSSQQDAVGKETEAEDTAGGDAAALSAALAKPTSEAEEEERRQQIKALEEKQGVIQEAIRELEAQQQELDQQLDSVLTQMAEAAKEDKQQWIDQNNRLVEQMTPLLQEKASLEASLKETRDTLLQLEIKALTGRNLAEEQRRELLKIPKELTADETAYLGILADTKSAEDDAAVRRALWQFYADTGYGKGSLPDSVELVNLETAGIGMEWFAAQNKGTEETGHTEVVALTLRLAQYTTEGDPILIFITCYGQGYLILTDNSRDAYRDPQAEEITLSYVRYLNWLTQNESTNEGDRLEMVIASDEPDLTYEEVTEGMLSSALEAHIPHVYLAGFTAPGSEEEALAE